MIVTSMSGVEYPVSTYVYIYIECMEGMSRMPDGCIDLVVVDPPYGTTGAKWDIPLDMDRLFGEYRRVLSERGTVVMFATEPFATRARQAGKDLYKYDLIWHKTGGTGFAHAKNMPLRNYENIMVFSKGSVAHKGNSNRMTYNPQGLQKLGRPITHTPSSSGVLHSYIGSRKTTYQNYTNYPKMVLEGFKKDSRVHMSAKPISLLEYLIRTYSNDGEVVMDNCAGSCSTGLAAFNTGRFFIGMENDKEIYTTGLERLKDHTALWSNAE